MPVRSNYASASRSSHHGLSAPTSTQQIALPPHPTKLKQMTSKLGLFLKSTRKARRRRVLWVSVVVLFSSPASQTRCVSFTPLLSHCASSQTCDDRRLFRNGRLYISSSLESTNLNTSLSRFRDQIPRISISTPDRRIQPRRS